MGSHLNCVCGGWRDEEGELEGKGYMRERERQLHEEEHCGMRK